MENIVYNTHSGKSFTARIYIAGDYDTARAVCREYANEGACVQIKRCEYIFTGGAETGVEIVLINYMRFPSNPDEIKYKAIKLAKLLIERLYQFSASVVTDEESIFIFDDRKM